MIEDRLKQIRLLKGLSPQEFANLLDISLIEYLEYENNLKPITIGRLFYICKVFNFDVKVFFNTLFPHRTLH